MIQQIIEFAKMVPGFMKLSQDDQIVLLKSASFELSCLRMSRYYDLNSQQVLFGETLMPMEALLTNDPVERRLVQSAFELAKNIAEMKLTESELALLSAYALLSPGKFYLIAGLNLYQTWFVIQHIHHISRLLFFSLFPFFFFSLIFTLKYTHTDRPGLKGVTDILRLNQAILKTLKFELAKTHRAPFKGNVSVLDALLARLPMLREISQMHMEALTKFRRAHPQIDFPALHKELFSVDI